MNVRSLKKQLVLSVLGALVLALSGLLYFSYEKTLHEIEEVFDAELAQTAAMIGKLALSNLDSKGQQISNPPIAGKGHKYEKHISYQVWYRDSLVLRSDSAPMTRMSDRADFSELKLDGVEWRVYGLYLGNSPWVIYTGEDKEARNELSWEIAISSLGMFVWSLPVFGLIIFLTVSRALRTLDRLSAEVRKQDVHHLSSINVEQVPEEVAPLINALNEMLARLDAAMSRERRFTSDASHELRTPLSSIRLHTQLALKTDDAEDKQQSLRKVIQAVDQSTHLVEQLLLLSKLPSGGHVGNTNDVDLTALCEGVAGQLAESASKKNISVNRTSLAAGERLIVHTNEQLLRTILRNLLDNAIRYSPANSTVHCSSEKTDDEVVIHVLDEGPGIPEAQLEQVRQRFFRIAGQEIEGCGLGLSIVDQACRHIGASFKLVNRRDGQQGLDARIRLPWAG